MQDEQSTLQKANDRLAMQRLKKGDLERRIRELGSLPDEAYEKYRGAALKRLQQELAQARGGGGGGGGSWRRCRRRCCCCCCCMPARLLPSPTFTALPLESCLVSYQPFPLRPQVNAELKKFGHINKKALDQYVNFTEQRDELQRRKEVRVARFRSQAYTTHRPH